MRRNNTFGNVLYQKPEEFLGTTLMKALTLEGEGDKAFIALGKKLGCDKYDARRLHMEAKDRLEEFERQQRVAWNAIFGELPVRLQNILKSYGVKSRREAISLVKKGTLHPKRDDVRNYGVKSHSTLCKFLNIQPAKRVCPHCGKSI